MAPVPAPPPPLMMSSQENIQKYLSASAEPQYITAESVRANKQRLDQQKRTESPDNDSAFCDNTSSNSGNSDDQHSSQVAGAGATKSEKCKNQLNLKLSLNGNSKIDSLAQAKAEKIRLAIEKIKEASIKKIFIKVFGEDGSAKSLLVDERMTVSHVCRMLAEKNHVKRDVQWGLVELLPDLHMERAYEDHELLVENLLMWKADSKNTLWFIKRPEVFDIFNRPEMYLLGETSSQIGLEMDDRARIELVEEYFSSSGVGAPEVEGNLYLKAESKKSWKKFHFVLRTSGLYYAPKGKKSSKDLVCLARFDVNQVYYGVKWQPKFKSPSRHCFAIKHPQIQAKNPKYIRYLCADTEQELNKWVTGIRLAKYGKQLYDNYRGIVEEMAHDDLDQLASSRFSTDLNQQQSAVQSQSLSSQNQKQQKVGTPDSNLENKSFDSALQMSDLALNGTGSSNVSSISSANTVSTKALVHSLPTGSTGSLSEKSQVSGVELGFNCDSPEGGTIKKKPKDGQQDLPAKKGVRFKESFALIEDEMDLPPPPMPPPQEPHQDFRRPRSNEQQDYKTRMNNSKSASFELEAELECLPSLPNGKLQRRYSDESLVSNPAMLHCGVVIPSYQDYPVISSPIKSPEPNRPAPVLKPQIGRKPSIDKSLLAKKDHVSRQPINGNNKQPTQRSPSYEDTLRKCQSLTRHNSSPVPSSPPVIAGSPVFRQTSCPVNTSPGTSSKPAVAPKPSPVVPPKPARLDSKRIVKHLPPSGIHSRSPSANGRKPVVNQAFLNDLQQAVSQKRQVPQNKFPTNGEADNLSGQQDRPFPNRFSSGEYENVQHQQSQQQSKLVLQPPPPLPKRNNETHLTWDRT